MLYISAAGELIDAGFRTVFGAETSQMSLLYVLAYIKAAGGIHDLTESTKNGGQEYKIKVNNTEQYIMILYNLIPYYTGKQYGTIQYDAIQSITI